MPVLGYDIAGQSYTGNNTYIYGSIDLTDEIGGKIKNFHCAIELLDSTNKNVKIAVTNCDQVFRNPSGKSVIEQVEYEVVISDDNEIAAPFSEDLSADTKYYIAIIPEGASTKYKYDSGFLESWYKVVVYGDMYPSPLPSGFTKHGPSYAWSVWVDYELLPYNKSILDSGVGTDLVDVSKTVFIVDVGSLLSEIVMSREALLKTMKIINAMDFSPKLSKAKKTETPQIMEAE